MRVGFTRYIFVLGRAALALRQAQSVDRMHNNSCQAGLHWFEDAEKFEESHTDGHPAFSWSVQWVCVGGCTLVA